MCGGYKKVMTEKNKQEKATKETEPKMVLHRGERFDKKVINAELTLLVYHRT